ncbi:MAG: NIPSNAP family protein [Marinilabiliales bacterium]|nr:NIPSNAP family protein [Marinilabiliales bacterium]
MITEIRTYRVKPGHRKEFIEFFEQISVPAMKSFGIKIIGPFIDLENPNKFVWLRSFSNLEEREKMKTAFYESDIWKKEIERVVMPILDAYDFALCETTDNFFFDSFD